MAVNGRIQPLVLGPLECLLRVNLRHPEPPLETSAPGGIPDVIGAKADIPILMSAFGGRADIDFGRLEVCL